MSCIPWSIPRLMFHGRFEYKGTYVRVCLHIIILWCFQIHALVQIIQNKYNFNSSDNVTRCLSSMIPLARSWAHAKCHIWCLSVNNGTLVCLPFPYHRRTKERWTDLLDMRLVSSALNVDMILVSIICLLSQTLLDRRLWSWSLKTRASK